jgi:hypothetical protein
MDHPTLIAALVEDRRHRCSCGTFTQQPCGLCRQCQAVAAWRGETRRTSRRASLSWKHAGTRKAHLFAWVASLLRIISKGAES